MHTSALPRLADRAAPHGDADAVLIAGIRLSKLLTVTRNRLAESRPVDTASYGVLFAALDEPARVSELASLVHSDVSTVSRQVSGLVERGLAERIPDPKDGRAHLIRVTDAGKRVIRELRDNRGRFATDLLAGWSPEDVATLRAGLERFGATLEDHLTATSAPPVSSPAPTPAPQDPTTTPASTPAASIPTNPRNENA